MNERQIPRPGEFYRHFKDRLYQVKAVAYDAETQAPCVVYQALYGDFRCWIRPLENFLSEVDHRKYPDVTQKWRFVRVTVSRDGGVTEVPEGEETPDSCSAPAKIGAQVPAGDGAELPALPETSAAPGKVLTDFLDTEDRQLRKGILMANRNRITQRDLESICLVLGIPSEGGDILTQIRGICRYLDMQDQYEGDRMRQGDAFRTCGNRRNYGGGHV